MQTRCWKDWRKHIDHGVGAELLVDIGDKISIGETWIRFDTLKRLAMYIEAIQNSISISDTKPTKYSRIIEQSTTKSDEFDGSRHIENVCRKVAVLAVGGAWDC